MDSNQLRRRGNLPPLVPQSERELQSDPFSTLYVSPCQIQVSNDPFDSPPAISDLVPCNLKEYSCPDKVNGATVDIPIEYDFEIYYDREADFDTTMQALEGASLQHAAALTGLLDCAPTQTAVERNGSLRRYLESLLTEDEGAALIAISSDPEDMADPANFDCIVPVPSDVSSGTTCQPVKGKITATIDADASGPVEAGITSGLLKTVRQGMIDDVYVTGNIKKVSFIGTRADDTSSSLGASGVQGLDSASKSPTGLSNIGIAFIAAACAIIVALIALLISRRQRRRAEERNMIFHDATVQAKEIAAASDDDEEGRLAAAAGIGGLAAEGGDDSGPVLEGSDVPGSLAYHDELALEPNPAPANVKTGDLSDSLSGEEAAAATHTSPLYQSPSEPPDYISDTQSFGSADSGGESAGISPSIDTESDFSSFGRSFDSETTGGSSLPANPKRGVMGGSLNAIMEDGRGDSSGSENNGLQHVV